MSTQPVRDYLTKQLLIENNIVTYRSLSRVLTLNVNVAKNELAEFHANDGQNLAATYLLSGQIQPMPHRYQEDVDMDDRDPYGDDEYEGEDGEYVPQTEIILVGERDLESVQEQFLRLETVHVYSLSPSAIRDAGLLCTPTEIVRNLDSKKGPELATAVGKVVSAQVNVSSKSLPSWGGRKAPLPVAGSSKVTAAASAVKKEEDSKPKEKPKAEKPKATGKLDFSKAKTKPLKKEEVKPVKAEPKPKVASRPPSGASTIGEKVQAKMEESKRGTKRKSALASDSEEEVEVKPAKPKPAKPAANSSRGTKRKSALGSDSEEEVEKPAANAQSSVRVRKGVVLSDEEDDVPQRAPPRKGKGKAAASNSDSEAEKNLRAMMDIDDDDVTHASRDTPKAESKPESEPEPVDEPVDVDMSDGESKPAPVKRKPKKVIPVGKNGLKKKRVVKSKTRVDEKGYMITDDYSEYESVEEEEAPPPPKGKAKVKEAAPAKPTKAAPKAASAKPAPAKKSGVASKPQGQASVASFFGKSKSK
ncbi:DNA polymerase subunit Cdc27 [Mycena vulgaris]|nr:DNA polymerase subunit Cdc27 [Mycena vulgaris]